MAFLGFFDIKDSLSDGVIEVVRNAMKHIMVNGGDIVPATAITEECGIL